MESGLFVSPFGLLIGLVLVIGLGLAIYLFGAAVAGNMRAARLKESTDGSGMQTGDPVNPVLGADEMAEDAERDPERREREPLSPL